MFKYSNEGKFTLFLYLLRKNLVTYRGFSVGAGVDRIWADELGWLGLLLGQNLFIRMGNIYPMG